MTSASPDKSPVLEGAPQWSGGLGKAVWRRCDLYMVMKIIDGVMEKKERKEKMILVLSELGSFPFRTLGLPPQYPEYLCSHAVDEETEAESQL